MPHWKTQGRVPAFSDAKLIDQWSGAMAIAPDENPIISQVIEYPGWSSTPQPVGG
jgi:glycine/D-amino acid oxidase-like deaminating enzyme